VTTAPAGMLSDYRIPTQASKMAIDGTARHHPTRGYGTESSDTWHKVSASQLVKDP
jgi:hypothetical protein